MQQLLSGERSLDDEDLQMVFLDWMESEEYNHFRNIDTGEDAYALSSKRGNQCYALRKADQRKEIESALGRQELYLPIKGVKNRFKTRALLITVTYDPRGMDKEHAWASLRSVPVPGVIHVYNVINSLDANLSDILGTHGKIVVKEAQLSGYPAPHMLLILDDYVEVEKVGVGRNASYRICDEHTLQRLGKDEPMRKLSKEDCREAIRLNPVWKYGFIDIEGIVPNKRFHNRKNAAAYLYKYLTKTLGGSTSSIGGYRTFKDIKDDSERIAFWTHIGNKCFRTRDITIGAGFKKRLGMIKISKTPAKSCWIRIRTLMKSELMDHKAQESEVNIQRFKDLMKQQSMVTQ